MKKQFVAGASLLVVVVASGVGFYLQRNTVSSPGIQKDKVPSSIKQTADQYLIDLVGKSEFNKNYSFDYEESEKCSNEPYGCNLVYRFLPAEQYGGGEYTFYYSDDYIGNTDKHIKRAGNDPSPPDLPSCEQDKNDCNFKLSFSDLKNIAKKESLDPESVELVMYEGQIVAKISYCDLHTTENRREVYIDLQDGKILQEGSNSDCEGIA